MTGDVGGVVERLRSLAECDARAGAPLGKCMEEAADLIERLAAEVERLRRAYNDVNAARDAMRGKMAPLAYAEQREANAIRRAEAAEREAARLRAVLEPFAAMADVYATYDDEAGVSTRVRLFRAARTALQEPSP